MCYRPRTIRNNSKHFDYEHDRVTIVVPCGQCGECLNKKRTDWQIRSYYEWLEAKSKNCESIFVTLTYNEKSIPRLFGHYCFNVEDIQKFHKRLRKAISQLFPDIVDAFSYIVCSEYGGETHRPHMHGNYFLHDPRITSFLFRSLVRKCWETKEEFIRNEKGKRIKDEDGNYLTRSVPNMGFVKFGSNGGVIDSCGAIEYVTKYVCKDPNYQEVFGDFFEIIKDSDGDIYEAYKQFKQFRLTSNGFGLYGLQKTDDDLLLQGKIKYYNCDGEQVSALPLYLERKKFFNVIYKNGESPRYVLNAGGILARGVRFDAMRESVLNKVDELLHNRDYIQDLNVWFDVKQHNSPYSLLLSDFDTPLMLLNAFKAYINNNVDDFVDYVILKRGFHVRVVDGLSFDELAILPYLHKDTCYTVDDAPFHCLNNVDSIEDYKHLKDLRFVRDNYERAFDYMSALTYMYGFSRDLYFKSEAKKLDNYKRLIV